MDEERERRKQGWRKGEREDRIKLMVKISTVGKRGKMCLKVIFTILELLL